MFKILKNMRSVTRGFRTSTVNRMINSLDTVKQTKVKTEEDIQKMIAVKMEEYRELILTESTESAQITAEITALDSKLRKSFGFSQDEDLTQFPVFNFDDPEIDNQL